QLLVQET
ncbi:TPR repeat family protein, partial [Chlamydia psittaci C1/97]